jgi:hypothetical protein
VGIHTLMFKDKERERNWVGIGDNAHEWGHFSSIVRDNSC